MGQPRALVVGAGIGGLAAAAALHRRGWAVTVHERGPALRPAGAAISLAPNAQRALDVVGLGDRVRALAAWHGDGGVRLPGGRWLSRTDQAAAAERFGGPLVLVHRAELVGMLAALLPAGSVRTADPVTLLDPGGADRPALVETAAGEREADLVVGADGLRSGVRRALFPSHPGTRYAGFTTWRMLAPAPATPFAPHETWGTGRLWGSHPLADGRVYAYAAATAPAGDRAPDREHAELLRRFGNWHHPVPAILAATEPADVLRHDVHTLAAPLPALHRGRTVLLGDAAHPMAPNLGQGGNQAIEDAVVLGHHCAPHADVIEATARYTADRAARTARVVRLSARAARLTLASSPVTAAARAALVAAAGRLGPGTALRALDGIADWRPPANAYAAGAPDGEPAAN